MLSKPKTTKSKCVFPPQQYPGRCESGAGGVCTLT